MSGSRAVNGNNESNRGVLLTGKEIKKTVTAEKRIEKSSVSESHEGTADGEPLLCRMRSANTKRLPGNAERRNELIWKAE